MEEQNEIKTVETAVVTTYAKLTLSASQCLDIKPIRGTKTYEAKDDKSRYYNLQYRTFIYDNKGFNVPIDDKFCELIDNGSLGEVQLMPTEKGYDFIIAKSQQAMWNAHLFATKRSALTVEHVRATLTMDDLNQLA